MKPAETILRSSVYVALQTPKRLQNSPRGLMNHAAVARITNSFGPIEWEYFNYIGLFISDH